MKKREIAVGKTHRYMGNRKIAVGPAKPERPTRNGVSFNQQKRSQPIGQDPDAPAGLLLCISSTTEIKDFLSHL